MSIFEAAQKPADIESLTVRSQESRVLMMSILERLVLDCGALFERDDDDKGAQLTIQASGGLRVCIRMDPNTWPPDAHVIKWAIPPWHSARLSRVCFRGDINVRRQESLDVAYGFRELVMKLHHGLPMAMDGTAYESAGS